MKKNFSSCGAVSTTVVCTARDSHLKRLVPAGQMPVTSRLQLMSLTPWKAQVESPTTKFVGVQPTRTVTVDTQVVPPIQTKFGSAVTLVMRTWAVVASASVPRIPVKAPAPDGL